jgi:hypothetical protein
MSQMIFNGSAAAMSVTKSQLCLSRMSAYLVTAQNPGPLPINATSGSSWKDTGLDLAEVNLVDAHP